jgi:hypothetical protein
MPCCVLCAERQVQLGPHHVLVDHDEFGAKIVVSRCFNTNAAG